MVKNQLGKDCLRSRVTIVRKKLFKASILLKIIIIVVMFLYASLGESSIVLASNTGPTVTSNEPITIFVCNPSLKETGSGI